MFFLFYFVQGALLNQIKSKGIYLEEATLIIIIDCHSLRFDGHNNRLNFQGFQTAYRLVQDLHACIQN